MIFEFISIRHSGVSQTHFVLSALTKQNGEGIFHVFPRHFGEVVPVYARYSVCVFVLTGTYTAAHFEAQPP